MNEQNYRRTISVRATPEQAYRAVTTGYGQWWTSTDDAIKAIGDRITFMFPPNLSYWIFEATKLDPNEAVELECVEAFHKIIDKPDASESEWLGSQLIFHIKPDNAQTRIHFDHVGLTPDLDCFDVCEAGWNLFFVDSLKSYLNTGVGKPHTSDRAS